ncbi:MAG TPA: hypothetical protein VNZ52_03660 [Candidatus Thermoplasmatota archaeon]|nr:hypothetical protein [Candidatus Thermoplasmatota archaeon]
MVRHGPHDEFTYRASRYVADARDRLHVQVPPKVRFELRRKAWHVLGATMAVPVLLFVPLPWAIGLTLFTIAVITAGYFVVRKRKLVQTPLEETLQNTVGRVIVETRRKDEDFPWASVLFLAALALIALGTVFFHVPKPYAFAAFGILGLGDAASAIVGIAYGKNPLPWNRRKSVEGTVAGIIAGFLAAVVFAAIGFAALRQVLPLEVVALCVIGAVVGMLLESVPGVQDNLVIPLGAWLAMVGVAFPLGLV